MINPIYTSSSEISDPFDDWIKGHQFGELPEKMDCWSDDSCEGEIDSSKEDNEPLLQRPTPEKRKLLERALEPKKRRKNQELEISSSQITPYNNDQKWLEKITNLINKSILKDTLPEGANRQTVLDYTSKFMTDSLTDQAINENICVIARPFINLECDDQKFNGIYQNLKLEEKSIIRAFLIATLLRKKLNSNRITITYEMLETFKKKKWTIKDTVVLSTASQDITTLCRFQKIIDDLSKILKNLSQKPGRDLLQYIGGLLESDHLVPKIYWPGKKSSIDAKIRHQIIKDEFKTPNN